MSDERTWRLGEVLAILLGSAVLLVWARVGALTALLAGVAVIGPRAGAR